MNRLSSVLAVLGCISLAACADITLPSAPAPVTPVTTSPAVDTAKTPTPPKPTFTPLATDYVNMNTYSAQYAQNAFKACIPHGSSVQLKVVSENQTVVVMLEYGWSQSNTPMDCKPGLDMVTASMTLQALSEGSTVIDVLFNYTLPNTTKVISHDMSFQALVSNKGN